MFYHGQLAKTMVKNLRKAGAIISLKDLGSYNVVIRKPLEGFYRDRKVITAGIPARYAWNSFISVAPSCFKC